jgi:iron complex outermembrane receptor protein
MKKILFFCLFLFPKLLLAQNPLVLNSLCNSTLEGKILDDHDRTVLEYASIYIVELQRGTTSDLKGNYLIKNLCDTIYTIQISHIGCEPIELKIRINGKTIQDFYPEHHTEELNKAEVFGEKILDQTTQSKISVKPEKLEQAKGFSLGRSLKSIPGVNIMSNGNSIAKPMIHGLHSNRVLILNNEIRQEGQQWGVEHAPEIDPFIAGELSVVKGANSVRYGSDAIAGVIIVNPKKLEYKPGLRGELNLIGMSNGRSGTVSSILEGSFKKLNYFSWRVQGTMKQNGTIHAPNYFLINTGLKEYNFSYQLNYIKKKYGAEIFYSQFNTKIGIFSASHIGNLTDLERAFNSPVPLETGDFTFQINRPYQAIEHELLKAKFYLNTGDNSKISFIYGRQYNLRNEFDKHRPLNDSLAELNLPDLHYEITTQTLDVLWNHRLSKHIFGVVGSNLMNQGNTYKGRALIPNFRNNTGGIFLIERFKHQLFEIEAGIRYDYKKLQAYRYQYISAGEYELVSPIHEFDNYSGNIGVIFKPDSNLNASLNIGTAWRSPSINELYSSGLHHGAAAMEYGNDQLKTENSASLVLSIRYSPSKKIYFESDLYYNNMNDFIYRNPLDEPVLTIRGAFPAFEYTQTDAILKGGDFFLKYLIHPQLELSTKYSILRAWNKTANDWLVMMPADQGEIEITYRLKNSKKMFDSYISVSSNYVNKQWRVPSNSDFVAPPNAYYLFDLNTSTTLLLGKQPLTIGFSVLNLLNNTYRDYMDRFRYFTDAIGRNYTLRIKIPLLINSKKTKQ